MSDKKPRFSWRRTMGGWNLMRGPECRGSVIALHDGKWMASVFSQMPTGWFTWKMAVASAAEAKKWALKKAKI